MTGRASKLDACDAVGRLLAFWREVDDTDGSWLHPADRAVLAEPTFRDRVRWDASSSSTEAVAEHRRAPARLQASLIPQPFLGDLQRADVVLCLPHPDLQPGSWLAERDGSALRQRKLAGLRQDGTLPIPFWPIDLDIADTGAFSTWWPRFAALAEMLMSDGWAFEEAIRDLVRRVACVAIVPYPSSSIDPVSPSLVAALPSSLLAIAAVREKAAKGATVVLFDDHAGWGLADDGERIRQAESAATAIEIRPATFAGRLVRRRMNPDPATLVPFAAVLAKGDFRSGE